MSDEIDFADGRFKIDCSQILLTKAGGSPLIVHGPGEIWQDEDGVLQYKIFADQAGYHGLYSYVFRAGVVGQLIPDEDFFLLEAQDISLPWWTARQVLPTLRGGMNNGLACGYLHELVKSGVRGAHPEWDFLKMRFRGKIEFPCNQNTQTVIRFRGSDRRVSNALNAAFFEDGNFRFEVLHESDHTLVSLQLPSGQLTAATPSHIHEALQFVIGRQLVLMTVETSAGAQRITRLMSASRGDGRMSPPLQFNRHEGSEHFWRMFTDYFRHVHSSAEPDWHRISRHVGSAIESTAASLEVRVLALAVAVEGLAVDCFPGLAPASPDFLAELNAVQAALPAIRFIDASEEIDGVALCERTLVRLNGSLNSMRAPRNSDILRAFIRNYGLPIGLYNSWSRLRNASAHGGGTGGRDIETILRLESEVLLLLYSLVFAAINYVGLRTDYSLRGWPARTWPIAQPPAAASAATQAP